MDSHRAQRHAALHGGLGHFLTGFGATTGSQDSGDMRPPVVCLEYDQQDGENDDDADDDDSDHRPRTLDENLLS